MKLFACTNNNQAGVTLVELIVSIVVIAVAVSGVLMAVQFTTMHSADPMIRQQAVAIADSYMEEILLKRYNDPDGVETGGAETGEDRPDFDDVYDYNNATDNQQPRDQTDETMPGLKNYRVDVQVEEVANKLGPSGLAKSANVTITVTHESANVEFTLTGYKAKY